MGNKVVQRNLGINNIVDLEVYIRLCTTKVYVDVATVREENKRGFWNRETVKLF